MISVYMHIRYVQMNGGGGMAEMFARFQGMQLLNDDDDDDDDNEASHACDNTHSTHNLSRAHAQPNNFSKCRLYNLSNMSLKKHLAPVYMPTR